MRKLILNMYIVWCEKADYIYMPSPLITFSYQYIYVYSSPSQLQNQIWWIEPYWWVLIGRNTGSLDILLFINIYLLQSPIYFFPNHWFVSWLYIFKHKQAFFWHNIHLFIIVHFLIKNIFDILNLWKKYRSFYKHWS